MPQRRFAKVARMRMSDVEVGDVVNKYPEAESGWFVVAQIARLFDGKLQVSDHALDQAVSGHDFDMIGVQFVSAVVVDDQPEIAEELLTVADPTQKEAAPEPAEDEAAEAEPAGAMPAALAGKPAGG